MTPPLKSRAGSAWILLAAPAAVLVAAGYGLFNAVQLSHDPLRLGDFQAEELALRITVAMQFLGPGPPLLPLLASMLLAGCLVLTGPRPVRSRSTGAGIAEPIGGSRQQLGLHALVAVSGLFALTYAAAAALALTADRALTKDTAFEVINLSTSVTVLAVNLAALGLLAAAFLPWPAPATSP